MKDENTFERLWRLWSVRRDSLSLEPAHLEHLRDQLTFIDSSCEAFDFGTRAEAKRLATSVRVLVHDTGNSRSLLARMGVKDMLPWADGTVRPGPSVVRRIKEAGMVPTGSLLTVIPDAEHRTWAPAFEQVPADNWHVKFRYWWEQPRIFDRHGTEASRRDVVMWLAHHDGGAHVDELPQAYEAIARGSSVGQFFSAGGAPSLADSPIPAAMRQIAEEVRVTIRSAFEGLLDSDPLPLRGRHAGDEPNVVGSARPALVALDSSGAAMAPDVVAASLVAAEG